jgi:uncharacterized protein YoaH (UPF0181 family)
VNAVKNVGAGLPAMAVDQYQMSWLTHRHRRQASSQIGYLMAEGY